MTSRNHALRIHARVGIAAVAVLIIAGTAATAASAAGSGWARSSSHTTATSHVTRPFGTSNGRIRYAVDRPLCSTKVRKNFANCFALKRVTVSKSTPGATAYEVPAHGTANTRANVSERANVIGPGPAGGYTPADLASAYQYNPTVNRSGQTIAMVDWFNDPKIKANLAKFDSYYGLRAETASSFRVVNQNGRPSPLPSSSSGKKSAGEIALDVETARGVCNTCRLILVEAKNSSSANLAIAEETAADLGATEISNSFGITEGAFSKSELDAYNEPGIVITASAGDDGWYDWDYANANQKPPNRAEFPATDPSVIAVGGDSLDIDGSGAITSESVWNNNGLDDDPGASNGPEGAGGGGCSKAFEAAEWQKSFPGYSAAGCHGGRLVSDISAVADPNTGLDIYDTWGQGDHGWITVGGTSLGSPLIASMFALAGGSGGAAYPAFSLYYNAENSPADVYDVVSGGNGFCGGDSTLNCGDDVYSDTSGATRNPNALGAGNVDCSFPRNNSDPATPPPLSSECNAVTGYDGPTGVGTPNGVGVLTSTSPVVTLVGPGSTTVGKKVTFKSTATEKISGQSIKKVEFFWGDNKNSSGGPAKTTQCHAYRKAGYYYVVLVVTDSLGQRSVAYRAIDVRK